MLHRDEPERAAAGCRSEWISEVYTGLPDGKKGANPTATDGEGSPRAAITQRTGRRPWLWRPCTRSAAPVSSGAGRATARAGGDA